MTNFEKLKHDIKDMKEPMEFIGYLSGLKYRMVMHCRKHCPDEIYNDDRPSYNDISRISISILGEEDFWKAEAPNINE